MASRLSSLPLTCHSPIAATRRTLGPGRQLDRLDPRTSPPSELAARVGPVGAPFGGDEVEHRLLGEELRCRTECRNLALRLSMALVVQRMVRSSTGKATNGTNSSHARRHVSTIA